MAGGEAAPGASPSAPPTAAAAPSCSTCASAASRLRPSTPPRSPSRPAAPSAGTVTCDPDGPLVAEVVRTSSDQYVGRVSIVRVFSGTLRPRRAGARLGPLLRLLRRRLRPRGPRRGRADRRPGAPVRPAPGAGRARGRGRHRLDRPAEPRGDRGHAVQPGPAAGAQARGRCRPRCCPWPSRRCRAPTRTSCPPRSRRLRAEDPSLRIEQNAETGQVVLWVMGEAHAEQALDRLRSRYGVAVEPRDVVVPLRETFAVAREGPRPAREAVRRPRPVRHLRHRGRAAAAGRRLRVRRQGGRRRRTPAVHRLGGEGRARPDGARRQPRATRSWTSGSPSPTARRTASTPPTRPSRARARWRCARPPTRRDSRCSSRTTRWRSSCPSEHVGSVMSDLSARRGRLLGTEEGERRAHRGAGRTCPRPSWSATRSTCAATTHGAGTFTRSFAHYEAMPDDLASEVGASAVGGVRAAEHGRDGTGVRRRAGPRSCPWRRCRGRTGRRGRRRGGPATRAASSPAARSIRRRRARRRRRRPSPRWRRRRRSGTTTACR